MAQLAIQIEYYFKLDCLINKLNTICKNSIAHNHQIKLNNGDR